MVAPNRIDRRDGKWDVSSSVTSYIDDGCPTVWRGSAPNTDESRGPREGASSKRHEMDSTPRSATRVKPIDGDLLQRLYRATMDEKRRAAEESRVRESRPGSAEWVLEAEPQSLDRDLGGLYIPHHLKRQAEEVRRGQREEALARARETPHHTTAQQQTESIEKLPQSKKKANNPSKSANKSASPRDVRAPGKHGRKAHVDLPPLPVEEDILGVIAEEGATFAIDEQGQEPVAEQEETDQGHKEPKKRGKKKGKNQNNAGKHAATVEDVSEVLMAGSLADEQDEPVVISENIETSRRSVKASSANIVAAFDEPLRSSHSRRRDRRRAVDSRSQKTTSSRSKPSRSSPSPALHPPSTRATPFKVQSAKADSVISFQEVGQGWAGEPSPRIGSRTSKTGSSAKDGGIPDVPPTNSAKVSQSPSSVAGHSEGNQSHTPVKAVDLDVRDWEEVAQSVEYAYRSEARGGWGQESSDANPAPSIRSLEGAATDWNESNADLPAEGARFSIRSRLVSIHGGKAVALAWGEETLGRSRSNQIAAKNLFNIPILQELESTKAASAQNSSRKTYAEASSGKPSRHEEESSRRSGRSHANQTPDYEQAHHASRSASAHEMVDIGSGWYQATPEVGRSFIPRSRSQSRVRTKRSYRSGQAGESEVRTRTASRHSHSRSFFATKQNSLHSTRDAHESGRDDQSRSAASTQPSVHDWAIESHKSGNVEGRNTTPNTESKQASVSSGYGWEDEYQSRQRSAVRSEERGSLRYSAAPGRRSPSEPIYDYDEPQVEVGEKVWSGTGTEQAISHSSQPHDPREHPTIFAGKGWISPHPLSQEPSEIASPPQSKIVLPEEAYPQGATMSYEEWQALQERGMRSHRNISQTESDQTRRARRHHNRYKFAGWGAQSSDGQRFEHESSRNSTLDRSRSHRSGSGRSGLGNNYHAPTVTSERSSEALFSDERPRTTTSYMLKDDRSITPARSKLTIALKEPIAHVTTLTAAPDLTTLDNPPNDTARTGNPIAAPEVTTPDNPPNDTARTGNPIAAPEVTTPDNPPNDTVLTSIPTAALGMSPITRPGIAHTGAAQTGTAQIGPTRMTILQADTPGAPLVVSPDMTQACKSRSGKSWKREETSGAKFPNITAQHLTTLKDKSSRHGAKSLVQLRHSCT
ncbi:hypothetical protein CLAFUW4_06998 [Fulvia fulva]|uniref:Uncharacterized protein n=1 Tax=Passalora fulva TaxID=5499 RepID=A0A9Q8PAU6_PASFU|nr:uncharacterized protein CLAFUR5_07134 [Fulvia fulva]KAK4621289.1 hypothetical protein CLAFUR4_07007 [Fulvia fulva]KAK4622758.1 hypothetical protein CLAFUR0_07005 [Fulvia fulva]UJO19094.1 hypothetical protein CLAFUR5_07134 [Fulvia fulva]WPV15863.1 hypothetical protein CLAFUW4_06998 [Fulvia fulva]WPV31586.1 hypothetical protein CLAFUW7_06998 [Fulvia fulva]